MNHTTLVELATEGVLAGLELPTGALLERLTGHASSRRFFRVITAEKTRVLVVYPAEERDGPARYLKTAKFFRRAGIRVPQVLSVGAHAVLVEDGGDELLGRAPPRRIGQLYRQASRAIVRLQRYGRRYEAPNPDVCLDASRLRWELDFMERYALRGWLGVDGGGVSRARAYDRLVDELERLPQALCHRDYHAHNLLVSDNRLIVLDFQDVMQGPVLYDIASLIWDNYCDVDPIVATTTIANFWAGCRFQMESSVAAEIPARPIGLPPPARQAFCLVGLQRCLKALGTFGYQVTVAGNRDYARYAPRTWKHASGALLALGWDDVLQQLQDFNRLKA